MKTVICKFNDKIPAELDLIKESEGLGSRTSTVTFLVKYYFLTKKDSLDRSIETLNNLLDKKVAARDLPSAEEQLSDV